MTKPDARALVHSPAELMSEYVAWAEHIQKDPGIKFGIPAIDKKVIPMRAGELISLIGRPGSAKTSLMAYLARQTANSVLARGKEKEEAVIYVTWEQSAEELANFFLASGDYSISDVAWGRVPIDDIKRRAVKGARLPIWCIGHGIGRVGLHVPRMTPEIVLSAIESMQSDFGVKPVLMLFDYLQLVPIQHARERVQQVTEAPIRIKELALRVGAPAVVGVQARREVDDRKIKLPSLRDPQWASSVEQTSDKVLALWRPATTEPENSLIEIEGQEYVVNDTLLIIRLLKQRGERARWDFGMYFSPEFLRLAELEKRAVPF